MTYRFAFRMTASTAPVILFLLFSCGAPQPFRQLDPAAGMVAAIDSICLRQVDEAHFPGLAVAMASKGNRLWSKGYGYADIAAKRPVDPKTDLFRIGSISKTVTASALARLAERKKIDLDLPIGVYFKDCPPDKARITLRQLGGHLGCIRHYNGFEFLSNTHYENVIDPLQVFIHDTLLCEPGTAFHYTTYGWTLISAVMELAMQKPFLEILEEEVSRPLSLTELKADHTQHTHLCRVSFYDSQMGIHRPAALVNNSNKWAGGGLICTAEDLARFGYALARPGYLKAKTLKEFTTNQATTTGETINYGIGFSTGTDAQGRRWYGHSGGSAGGTSMMLVYPDEDLVVITLVNLSSARMDDLAWRIAEVVRKKE